MSLLLLTVTLRGYLISIAYFSFFIVSGTLKVVIPPNKKHKRKVYRYQKVDYGSMRNDTLKFAKERFFNGHSDTRSIQENFNLITSFIQVSADKNTSLQKLAVLFPQSHG